MNLAPPTWPAPEEIRARLETLIANMARENTDILVLTSRLNLQYYTGFCSQFWASETRPLFAVVKRAEPKATLIIHRNEQRNAQSIAPFISAQFYAGFTDAGFEALGNHIAEQGQSLNVGFDYGTDMFGRGSIALVDFLRHPSRDIRLSEAAGLIWQQRLVKSAHEFESKRAACKVATDGFFAGLDELRPGMTEYQFAQILKQKMIGFGADSVEWLPVRFSPVGRGGTPLNGDVRLQPGDFIWVDMGARRADQISDLNRIAKLGKATDEQQDLYAYVRGVTLRLAELIRPGMTGDEVFRRFEEIWAERNLPRHTLAGRIGHGSGLGLTEPPSLMAGSEEVIQEDMILHLEPKMEMAGGMFQTEEAFRVTSQGPEFLSKIAPEKLPVVEI